jgi:hypothetical protein
MGWMLSTLPSIPAYRCCRSTLVQLAAGFHPLCSIDIGDARYQECRALFRKSLGGIS